MSYGRGFRGSKYEETKNLDVKAIAKLVRRDLKAEFGKGYKFSVKIQRCAGGCSLSVSMMAMPELVPLYNREKAVLEVANPHGHHAVPYRSPEHQALVDRMDAVVTAYLYDDSDSMTDYYCVNFHKHIEVDSSLTGPDRKAALAEAKAELERAEEAYTQAGKVFSESESRATPFSSGNAREMRERGAQKALDADAAERGVPALRMVPAPAPKPDAPIPLPVEVSEPYFVTANFAKLNKNDTLAEYEALCRVNGFDQQRVKVLEVMVCRPDAYDALTTSFLSGRPEHFSGQGGHDSDEEFPEGVAYFDLNEVDRERFKATCYTVGILVTAPGRRDLIINPEGFNYARYVGLVVKIEAPRPKRAGAMCEVWGQA